LKSARIALMLVSVALLCVAGGCAMLKGGPSDEKMLGELLQTYKTGMEGGDAEAVIALYSENYESARGGTYEEMVERMRQYIPRMAERDIELGIEDAEVQIDGDTARVGPIVSEGRRGTMRRTLICTKEDGCWRITGSERQRSEE
jgi:ketosteroid isomerase-like protein